MWLPCEIWDHAAKTSQELIRKGSTVKCVGTLISNKWTDKVSGEERKQFRYRINKLLTDKEFHDLTTILEVNHDLSIRGRPPNSLGSGDDSQFSNDFPDMDNQVSLSFAEGEAQRNQRNSRDWSRSGTPAQSTTLRSTSREPSSTAKSTEQQEPRRQPPAVNLQYVQEQQRKMWNRVPPMAPPSTTMNSDAESRDEAVPLPTWGAIEESNNFWSNSWDSGYRRGRVWDTSAIYSCLEAQILRIQSSLVSKFSVLSISAGIVKALNTISSSRTHFRIMLSCLFNSLHHNIICF